LVALYGGSGRENAPIERLQKINIQPARFLATAEANGDAVFKVTSFSSLLPNSIRTVVPGYRDHILDFRLYWLQRRNEPRSPVTRWFLWRRTGI
jgi:hypothetical protein